MRRWLSLGLAALVALAVAPATAGAQPGAVVHGVVAAAIADGETAPLFGGGVTYRVNRALGFGVELSHLRSLEADFPYIYYCCYQNDTEERSTVFTTNVRVEIPTLSRRVIPFVVGGGGVAAVTRTYGVVYALAAERIGAMLPPLGLSILPGPSEFESTITSMALTLGGGASFLLSDHIALDTDLRVLHLMGEGGRNIGRFGVGASYRF